MERQAELAGEPSGDLWSAGQPAPRHPPCYNPLPLQLTWQAFSKTKKKHYNHYKTSFLWFLFSYSKGRWQRDTFLVKFLNQLFRVEFVLDLWTEVLKSKTQ